ncbi:WecB/TagA/CpsF family glycosyltransferase [Thermosynechococcaceae cyanobacterium Okahandja]
MTEGYILGTRVVVTTYEQVCDRLGEWIAAASGGYIVAANVHVVMTGVWQRDFQAVVNGARVVTADGMPLVWGLRLLGCREAQRVYGPQLMLAVCDRAVREGWRIFLYGSEPWVLERLQTQLETWFPGLKIVGSYAPPFRSLTPAEEAADRQRIRASGADVVFVSLGCPKQERWMARQSPFLPAVLLGVGAAFNFHSGVVAQAPPWLMALGLEWLFRLWQEPRRLWQRYLINNPAFIVLFCGQLLGHTFHRWRRHHPH